MWLAKQETLTPPGRLVSPLVLERNRGPWMCITVHCCYDTALMWYIHYVFHIFQRIALNWIHSFASWRYGTGALESTSHFTAVTPRCWCFSFFMWYIHNFFHIFRRIALNRIHRFASWRNAWHVTIIWPIRPVTLRNKSILHSNWNWFYESFVLCSALLTYMFVF